MKIQIDTNEKTIKLLDSIKIGELFKALRALLGDTYKVYTISAGDVQYITWTNPYYVYWEQPYKWPSITYDTTTDNSTTSVYNIEIKDYEVQN